MSLFSSAEERKAKATDNCDADTHVFPTEYFLTKEILHACKHT